MSRANSGGWHQTAEIPVLGQFDIHIWRINLARPFSDVERLIFFLSPAERERAARFCFVQNQRRFIIRRSILRQLLAAGRKTSPETISIKFTAHGKPFVSDQEGSYNLRFSCSHSADLALVAISRGVELGVDLEQQRFLADAEDLARSHFSRREFYELAGLPQSLKTVGFFNCWTRKEAFVKAIGLGLSFPLNRFSVSLAPDKPATILDVADSPAVVNQWEMIAFEAGADYSAAIVSEGKKPCIKFLEWNPYLLD
jgi:4'-phosphopantetheinyl transferase